MSQRDLSVVRPGSVIVDATSLTRKMKGVGRYTWQLCNALSAGLPRDVALNLVVFEGELPAFPEGFRAEWIRLPYYSEIRLGLWEFPQLIHDTGASVFIRPADKIGRQYAVPTLTVCHDVNPLIWKAQPPKKLLRRMVNSCWERLRGQGLRQSNRVICNSNFIREAATRHFGLASSRTSVGYCGVDRRIPQLAAQTDLRTVRRTLGTSGFLLAFATGDEREGFRILPELWANARKAGYPGKLVIAGVKEDANYAKSLREDFKLREDLDSVVFFPFFGEDKVGELAGLYGAADFYLETSRHEGFGMQLVEAMACGTTCFSSGRGALEEVGGSFPLHLNIEVPAAAGKAVAVAWQEGLHQRDNRDQVLHALSFDWTNSCKQVVQFALGHLKQPAK